MGIDNDMEDIVEMMIDLGYSDSFEMNVKIQERADIDPNGLLSDARQYFIAEKWEIRDNFKTSHPCKKEGLQGRCYGVYQSRAGKKMANGLMEKIAPYVSTKK